MTDRSTAAKKWLKFETTEFNPKTGQIETCSGGITDHFCKMSFFRSFISPLKRYQYMY